MKPTIKTTLLIVVVMLLTMMSNQTALPQAHADGAGGSSQVPVKREVPLPVKVVFIGIDPATVDTSYIKWNFNLPTTTYGQILSPQPYLTGVVFKIDYSFTFATDSYKSKLLSYLRSIEVTKTGPDPWFYYYVGQPSGYVSSSNYYDFKYATYDANQVEDWIYKNQQDLGGFASNGWTLIFMNLPELPSFDFQHYKDFLKTYRDFPPNGTAHYYSIQRRDPDLGYRFRFRDFMTAWGGVHRLWFADLSAGPSHVTNYEDLPLQMLLKDNQIDLRTPFGKTWFTEYLSDYIWQATWNFITPFFVYAPTYSEKYTFHVHVFDNRTYQEQREVDIKSTINAERIKQAFEDLLPYSKIDVAVNFEDMSKYPALTNIIYANYKFTDSFTFGVNGQPLQYGVVDVRSVYKYVQDNLRAFEPNFHRDRSEFTVPVFAFAFSKETLLTYTYKWMIESQSDTAIQALLGIALGDIALVSFSQRQFQSGDYVSPPQPNMGYGFTSTVIHESGHMLGLPHPFDFGPIGQFTLSAMGYYTWDSVFGQSDKDALRRAHVDSVYLEVQSMVEQLSRSSAQADAINAVRVQLRDVDAKYYQMDYAAALASVLKAEDTAKALSGGATVLPGGIVVQQGLASAVYVIFGVSVGLVVGFAAAWLIFKKRVLGPTTGRRARSRPK